jgi:hypothetical protein
MLALWSLYGHLFQCKHVDMFQQLQQFDLSNRSDGELVHQSGSTTQDLALRDLGLDLDILHLSHCASGSFSVQQLRHFFLTLPYELHCIASRQLTVL